MIGFAGPKISEQYLTAVSLSNRDTAWQIPVDKFHGSGRQIATNDSYIYVRREDSPGFHVYLQDGTFLKEIAFPDTLVSSMIGAHPILMGNQLFMPNYTHFYTYDISDAVNPVLGWQLDFDHKVQSVATDSQGGLYVGVYDRLNVTDAIYRLDPANGNILWQASTYTDKALEHGTPNSMEVNGDKLIVSAGGTVQAFDTATGERLWVSERLLCPGDGTSVTYAITFAEGNAYLAPAGGACVFAVDLTDGSIVWTHSASIAADANFSYGGKVSYRNGVIYASNARLWALDAGTGKVLSLAKHLDSNGQSTYVKEYNGQILVWGKELIAYKPIR